MTRTILFDTGIVDGSTVRDMMDIFPELKTSFTQRKTYDEYYYKETKVDVSYKQIKTLTHKYYAIAINNNEIVIT